MMKLLIAYDGSASANDALDDLLRAGLPEKAKAIVFSVAELWFPPPTDHLEPRPTWTERPVINETEALSFAQEVCVRLRSLFPAWEVAAETASGSPAPLLLEKAGEWQPDLIVVGSHGRSALGRFLFGSVAQKVVNEADCTVRVARQRVNVPEFPVRILVGVDGSVEAFAAIELLASRVWPEETEARIVTAIGDSIEEKTRATEIQMIAESKLRAAGLKAASIIITGDPKQVLLAEAEVWGADCIYVGHAGEGRLERFLPGSVATAVVASAHCSVEVVRRKC